MMPANSLKNNNRLKLGIFSANCSSGMAVTKVEERWQNSWHNNLELVRMCDVAGIEFMLPIARWIGYGDEEGALNHRHVFAPQIYSEVVAQIDTLPRTYSSAEQEWSGCIQNLHTHTRRHTS